MADYKHIEVDGKSISFYNRWESTRSGFRHISSMFLDGEFQTDGIARYINRTWERYSYQTSMTYCVENLIAAQAAKLERIFRQENNVSRMTEKRRGEFNAICDGDKTMTFYRKIIKALA